MTFMMTLRQAGEWTPGSQLRGSGEVELSRVHTDTRTLLPGDLFVALKGDRFDGSQFLQQARAKGACAAICQAEAAEALTASGLPGLLVSDARVALGALAANWRRQFDLPIIAVTGSNGKTTVTQMIGAILTTWKGERALVTQGNFNNDIGVPLTLLKMRSTHAVAVLELGMNHPGEIGYLAKLVQPTVGLVNNAQREHLEFMSSVEAVARENGSVLQSLGPTGVSVFPVEDACADLWTQYCAGKPRLLFAFGPATSRADVHGRGVFSGDGWQLEVNTPQGNLAVQLKMAGRHNAHNAMAAISAALAVHVPLEIVRAGLESFRPVAGRSRASTIRVAGHDVVLVDDAYNANPDSVRAAIDLLSELPSPRLLVLGDMGEVGENGSEMHREVGEYARLKGIDQLFALGSLSKLACQAFGSARHFDDQATMIASLAKELGGVGSVLVKGSRFMGMERVVRAVENMAGQNRGENHAA